MLAIEKLSRTMEMLLNDADKLEDTASLLMPMDKDTATALLGTAEAMLAQVTVLHGVAVKKINEQKARKEVEIPPYMEKLWAEKHSYLVDKKSMLEHKAKTLKVMPA